MLRLRFPAVVVLAAASLLWCLPPLGARPTAAVVDEDYVAALAAATRFLQAWQAQDQENVILMLSDRLRQHTAESTIEEFVSPASSTNQAYELGRGRRLATGRYQFPVTLFTLPAGNHPRWIQPHSSDLVLVKSGKNDWLIDKLP
jgi:hypothetical protein